MDYARRTAITTRNDADEAGTGMTSKKTERVPAEQCADVDAVRAQIDRVDSALVDLVAERWSYVDRIWMLKDDPSQATVPWRIQQVIDKVRARAAEKGVPPELVESLWRQLIGWGVQYEEEKLRQKLGKKSD
jgi:isochorismate pyruvate lyase